MKKVLVTGAAGFIGSHLARYLRAEGCWVRGVDWKQPEFMVPEDICDEFCLLDLRDPFAASLAFDGMGNCEEIYQLAADMGGMQYITTQDAVIGWNNAAINLNVLNEAQVRQCGAYLFTSSACIYPTHLQEEDSCLPLAEDQDLPARPQHVYGWEKLYAEQVLAAYQRQYGLNSHIVRFHNIMGECGTYQGGREKAPAAFARKVAVAKRDRLDHVEMWGDGEQTRTFLHVDDCVRAIVGIQRSGYHGPVNIGSEEPISMNDLMALTMRIAGYEVPVRHIEGPVGVRGRNCDSSLIRRLIQWRPEIRLEDAQRRVYQWVESQVHAA